MKSKDKVHFQKPRITISKVYTKSGDKGMTSLVGGQRKPKSHPRIEAYGTVDELNCFIGKALETSKRDLQSTDLENILWRIQHELFNLGSLLATLPEDIHPKQAKIQVNHIQQLEKEIDTFNEDLPDLKSFILPSGSPLASDLHICRSVCRRAERLLQGISEKESVSEEALIYLNRLSDLMFVFSRWVLKQAGKEEAVWDPNC